MSQLFADRRERTYWGYLKLQLKAAHATNRRSLSGLVFITTAVFLGVFTLVNHNLSKQASLSSAPEAIITVAPTTASPNPSVLGQSHTPPTPAPVVYRLSLQSKPELSDPSAPVADLIVDALKLPLVVGDPFPLKAITFDTSVLTDLQSKDASRFSQTYYVVTDNSGAIKQTYYESAALRLNAKPADSALLPYLLNHRFCQVDQDCRLRQSYCDYGSYNRFEPLLDSYSCLSGQPQSSFSATLQCDTISQPVNPRCLNNQCTADQELVCISN